MGKKLKLYVWQDVFCDYTCGLAVALAPDLETAREMLYLQFGGDDWKRKIIENTIPDEVTIPAAFHVVGGS